MGLATPALSAAQIQVSYICVNRLYGVSAKKRRVSYLARRFFVFALDLLLGVGENSHISWVSDDFSIDHADNSV